LLPPQNRGTSKEVSKSDCSSGNGLSDEVSRSGSLKKSDFYNLKKLPTLRTSKTPSKKLNLSDASPLMHKRRINSLYDARFSQKLQAEIDK